MELSLGYTFYQSLQFDLTQFDLQDHRPQAQLTVHAGPAQFNLLGRYDFYLLQTDKFLSQATALPWVNLDESFGRTQVYYRMRYRDFLKSPYDNFLDGWIHEPGLQQFVYLGQPDRFLSMGYQFGSFVPIAAQSTRFAYNANQVNAGLGWAFPFDI